MIDGSVQLGGTEIANLLSGVSRLVIEVENRQETLVATFRDPGSSAAA
jgi:hypothetical protein